MEVLIWRLFKDVTIVSFQDRDTACEFPQRGEPDLLITDLNNNNVPSRAENLGMNGRRLLDLLRRRKADYPVLLVSGCLSLPTRESVARKFAGPDLMVSFVAQPFAEESFQQKVRWLLGGAAMCGRQFSTDQA